MNTLKINADAEIGVSATLEAEDDPILMTIVFHPTDVERVCVFVNLIRKVSPDLEITFYIGGYKVEESLWMKYVGEGQ